MNNNSSTRGFIQRSLDLAKLGGKKVRPNPMVGAVLVHNEQIIGEGYHAIYGGPHAEVNCLNSVSAKDRHLIPKSTLFVSLEPCNYYGKTPACTNLILENDISNVVISTTDPNPEVDGNGLNFLRKHGVKVDQNILEEEGDHLIRYFKVNHLKNRPYVVLKIVKSRDNYIGKMGERIWISNNKSTLLSHKWRAEADGILIGTNTALNDNPQLNNRLFGAEDPTRIVLDRNDLIPDNFNLKDGRQKTLIYTEKASSDQIQNTSYFNIEFDQQEFIQKLLSSLFENNIYVLLVEGGAKLIRSFIKSGHWDEARVITSPKMLENGIKAPNVTGSLWKTMSIEDDHLEIILR